MATKEENEAQEASRLKSVEFNGLKKDLFTMRVECKRNMKDVNGELCGLKKIRGELMKMDKDDERVQDCEVSDWVAEECSERCDGGTQKLTRPVLTMPYLGA